MGEQCGQSVNSSRRIVPISHKRSMSDSEQRFKKDKLGSSHNYSAALVQDVRETECQNATKEELPPLTSGVPCSLKQEIRQLEKRLHDQFAVRRALEKALGHKSYHHHHHHPLNSSSSNDNSLPKQTKELVKEIAILELEVIYLEQHLLSLYRKAFNQQLPLISNSSSSHSLLTSVVGEQNRGHQNQPTSSDVDASISSSSITTQNNKSVHSSRITELARKSATASLVNETTTSNSISSSSVGRSHSSLLHHHHHRSVFSSSSKVSPAESKNLARALKQCHTLPLTFLEEKGADIKMDIMDDKTAGEVVVSLAEHLGASIADHVPLTPNRLSEEMLRCMYSIYCKCKCKCRLPHLPRGFSSSSPCSCSSFSSLSAFPSSQYNNYNYVDVGDIWSPRSKRDTSSVDHTYFCQLDNKDHSFQLLSCETRDCSGPLTLGALVEVTSLCTQAQWPADVEDMLYNYRSLVQRLETVDPSGMKNEEKLAFWINIHNSMMMHAHLEHGVPQNNKKRLLSLSKTAYIIKGQSINAEMIQSQILGCSRNNPPGQWLWLLLHGKWKSKLLDRGELQNFGIEQPEPLLHFALCSGSHSDPMVRIYKAKRVKQQLETAKEEYVRARMSVQKEEQRIILPRLVESYARDANLGVHALLQMVECHLPHTLRAVLPHTAHQQGATSSRTIIQWMPHNLTFRFLLSRDLNCQLS